MSRPRITLYTKSQIERLFRNWQCTETIPGKGKKVVICFAGQDIDLIEVEWTDKKSDAGERLWAVTCSSAWGREIQRLICESHVLVWREFVMARRREKKVRERTLVLEQIERHEGDDIATAEAIATKLSIPVSEAFTKVRYICR